MLWEADNERDERKNKFIEMIKNRKCRRLLGPLSEKLLAYDQDEIGPEEVFKAAEYAAKKGKVLISDFKKRPDVILAGIAMDENRYLTGIGDIGVSVRKADVTEVFSDTIICPALPDGSMSSGAAAIIRENGGKEIEEELRSKAPIVSGTAVSTGPGKLTASHIIHINTMGPGDNIEIVRSTLLSALVLAEQLDAATLAIPGFAGGSGGLSPADSALVVLEVIKAHKAENVTKIILTDQDENVIEAIVKALEKYDEEDE